MTLEALPFATRLAQAGLVVDPRTARIPVVLGGATYAIEAHETTDGCLLRCDVESPGTGLEKYAEALNGLGRAEPGTTEVLVDGKQITVLRHLSATTSDDLRSAVQRLAGLTRMAEEVAGMLRTADAADARIAAARAGRFTDLRPAIDALASMPDASATVLPAAEVADHSAPPPAPPVVARRQPIGFVRLWFVWAVATAIAFGLAAYLSLLFPVPGLLVHLVLTWTLVAALQALALTGVFSRPSLWFPLTLLAGVAGRYLAIALTANASLPAAYTFAIAGGGLTALVQCLYLRGRVAGLQWWVAAGGLGAAVQLFVQLSLPALNLPAPLRLSSAAAVFLSVAAAVAISGLALGLVTGLTLALLRFPGSVSVTVRRNVDG